MAVRTNPSTTKTKHSLSKRMENAIERKMKSFNYKKFVIRLAMEATLVDFVRAFSLPPGRAKDYFA